MTKKKFSEWTNDEVPAVEEVPVFETTFELRMPYTGDDAPFVAEVARLRSEGWVPTGGVLIEHVDNKPVFRVRHFERPANADPN